jgi:hypothetical protein
MEGFSKTGMIAPASARCLETHLQVMRLNESKMGAFSGLCACEA